MIKVRRQSLKEQAYNIIKEKILSQQLQLEAKINITELSHELNISNTPIREALTMLSNEGLVKYVPNAGMFVTDLQKKKLVELIQTVPILITGGYELCMEAARLTPLLTALEERLKKQKKLLHTGKSYAYAIASINFDSAFIDICENEILSGVFSNLTDLLTLIVVENHKSKASAVENNLEEHEAIVEAVKHGDHTGVRQLIKKHYRKADMFV